MGLFERYARRRGWIPKAEQRTIKVRVPIVAARRTFSAAGNGQLVQELPRTPFGIDHDLRLNQRVLVARARWLRQNDDYVRRLFQLLRQNIVGAEGIRFQSKVEASEGEADTAARRAIEDGWTEFMRGCDSSGQLDGRELQNLFVDHLTQDGEFLAIHNEGTDRNRFRYDVTVCDPLRLDHTLNASTAEGNDIVMGVELRTIGRETTGEIVRRPVAYWLLRDRLDYGIQGWSGGSRRGHIRVPIENIVHAFTHEFAEQTRGFTMLCSGIARINMLGGYEDSVAVAARAAAAQSVFVEEPEGGGGFEGDTAAGGTELEPELETEWEIEPGFGRRIPHGAVVHPYTPSQPSTNHPEFIRAVIRGAAAGWGVSYHTLANDLADVNFSTGRIGELVDRDGYKSGQETLIKSLMRPMHARWLRTSIMAGALTIKGRPLEIRGLARYSAAAWQGRRWEWVDPLKAEQANDLKYHGRRTTISQQIREAGLDPDDVFREYADELRKLGELGIPVPAQPPAVPPAADQPADAASGRLLEELFARLRDRT